MLSDDRPVSEPGTHNTPSLRRDRKLLFNNIEKHFNLPVLIIWGTTCPASPTLTRTTNPLTTNRIVRLHQAFAASCVAPVLCGVLEDRGSRCGIVVGCRQRLRDWLTIGQSRVPLSRRWRLCIGFHVCVGSDSGSRASGGKSLIIWSTGQNLQRRYQVSSTNKHTSKFTHIVGLGPRKMIIRRFKGNPIRVCTINRLPIKRLPRERIYKEPGTRFQNGHCDGEGEDEEVKV
jgi:hypothetical protein